MHEILAHLPAGSCVLDLGCAMGSFDAGAYRAVAVRCDVAPQPAMPAHCFVQADAARLPFRSRAFHAVISNHSLEHFENLEDALAEIGRVIKPEGALYVAVPDSTTLGDRIYRWLGRGGGHVNPFASAQELATRLEGHTGLRHVATKTLCTSLSFLNRRNIPGPKPKRLALFAFGWEPALACLSAGLRFLDRFFRTRASLYGWALYFGNIQVPVDGRTWSNVCVRCGQGHPSDWLAAIGAVRRRWYRCPHCGARNFFTSDYEYAGRK